MDGVLHCPPASAGSVEGGATSVEECARFAALREYELLVLQLLSRTLSRFQPYPYDQTKST